LRYVRDSVSSSGNGLVAGLAVPDTDGVSLDGGLSAEGADISGVLGDFHLLDLLTEGRTVSERNPTDQQFFTYVVASIPTYLVRLSVVERD
jgi:hypothetical protein